MINNLYGCHCPNPAQINCQNFGYLNPSNCGTCICPYGFGGDDCSKRSEPGDTIEASTEWKNITAPTNKTIEVQVNNMTGVECGWGCTNGGIEVKTEIDPRITSPRACCHSVQKQSDYCDDVQFGRI